MNRKIVIFLGKPTIMFGGDEIGLFREKVEELGKRALHHDLFFKMGYDHVYDSQCGLTYIVSPMSQEHIKPYISTCEDRVLKDCMLSEIEKQCIA